MSVRPIRPDDFAELAWRVLFLKGEPRANPFSSTPDDRHTWHYEDSVIYITDFESRDYLTVRYVDRDLTDHHVLLSKRRSMWECFYPDERAVAHLERLLVLDTLANL